MNSRTLLGCSVVIVLGLAAGGLVLVALVGLPLLAIAIACEIFRTSPSAGVPSCSPVDGLPPEPRGEDIAASGGAVGAYEETTPCNVANGGPRVAVGIGRVVSPGFEARGPRQSRKEG